MAFFNEINLLSDQTVQLCYHCHKCTSGCPVAEDMEYGPDQILRLVQMGEKDVSLHSHDIWLCAGCETCGTRCPNEIDIARVMDALRQVALAEGVPASEPDAVKFHKIFMFVVEQLGRSWEAGSLGGLKAWTLSLSDMDSGLVMFAKGKIPLIPHIIKDRAGVKRIFKETTQPVVKK